MTVGFGSALSFPTPILQIVGEDVGSGLGFVDPPRFRPSGARGSSRPICFVKVFFYVSLFVFLLFFKEIITILFDLGEVLFIN